ncbi:hypothetical protein H0H92_010715 [Tricholoma furcatifolium]|nr:hypothetical protein H0H92_010715 [Tricholoma furcatifolium]
MSMIRLATANLKLCIVAFFVLASSTICTPVEKIPYFVQHENAVPDQYIVKIRDGAAKDNVLMHMATSNTPTLGIQLDDWHPDFNLFIGKFNSEQLMALQLNPDVEYIEQDAVFYAPMPITEDAGHFEDEPSDDSDNPVVNATAPWLVHIENKINLIGKMRRGVFPAQAKIVAFPIRIHRINVQHRQFGGRAQWGETFIGTKNKDVYGHGTMVSGVVAGSQYGIAKQAKLIAVKVMDDHGHGTLQSVINGLVWVLKRVRGNGADKVVNMSINFDQSSPSMNDVLARLKRSKIHLVAAAGNDNKDAKTYTPANSPSVITVGASTIADARWADSNWGKHLDLFAPGEHIYTAGTGTPTTRVIGSGTSLAAPHVAGILAYFITRYRDHNGDQLKELLLRSCQKNLLSNIGRGSPNLLAQNGAYVRLWAATADSEGQLLMESESESEAAQVRVYEGPSEWI